MTSLIVEQFMTRQDNFGVLIHDPLTGETASIDAPDGERIKAWLDRAEWTLTHIFVTHHHGDHVEGIPLLASAYDLQVIGPSAEAARIDGLTKTVAGGDSFAFAGREVHIIDTPGHTAGHIAFHIPEERLLFVGDTLFALGCGRLFEGTPADMHASLTRLAELPEKTRFYCGHEYTRSNARFALSVDPDNKELLERSEQIDQMLAKGLPTLPSTIGYELRTNPFMRTGDPAIRKQLGMENAADEAVFAELRQRKDVFQ